MRPSPPERGRVLAVVALVLLFAGAALSQQPAAQAGPPPAAEQVLAAGGPAADDGAGDLAAAEATLARVTGSGPGSLASAVPEDVAALIGSNGSGSAAEQQAQEQEQEQVAPSERKSQLISLLRPPPGFQPPPLTQDQLDAVPRLRKARQGTATVVYRRSVGSLDAATMNCGIAYLNSHFKDHFVGLPDDLYSEGRLCGACVRMWCVDSVCEGALASSALFQVVDSCADCKGQDLVVSLRGFQNLTGGVNVEANPTLQVAWNFESCALLITGGIRMMPSDKTSAFFLGLQFSNLKGLLREVAIQSPAQAAPIRLQRTEYGYWVIDTPGTPIPLRPPYQLALTSAQGQRLVVPLANLRAQDLGVNFG